jgi:hypothetical protein
VPHVPEVTALTEAEMNAYRHLLYDAMVYIRGECYASEGESRSPLVWLRQYRCSRVIGALAEWMHNLAYFASNDFKGFDAAWFWDEYDRLVGRFEDFGPDRRLDYRQTYDYALNTRTTSPPDSPQDTP